MEAVMTKVTRLASQPTRNQLKAMGSGVYLYYPNMPSPSPAMDSAAVFMAMFAQDNQDNKKREGDQD
jgi:hypothetical protein